MDVLDIACGYGFSAFAVKHREDFSLFGCGLNTDRQIGYHKYRGETNKPLHTLIYPAPITLPMLPGESKIQIKKVAAGRAHLLALSDNGVVYTLGHNAYGQCGRPVVDGEDYGIERNAHRIDGLNGNKIVGINCGQDHSLFLTENGRIYSCGWGADGQTGLGTYNSVDEPTLIGGDISTENIVKVAGTVDCVLALSGRSEIRL